MTSPPVRHDVSLLTETDLHLFNEGRHFTLFDRLGAHPTTVDGVSGVSFAVWAPNAEAVAVAGDFNGWDTATHPLAPRAASGIWEGFVPGVPEGSVYKFHIRSRLGGGPIWKADPFAFRSEAPPRTGSVVAGLGYRWHDDAWMAERGARQRLDAPISIYELHPGSWRRMSREGDRWLSYRELAARLAEYVRGLGFTHVEFMPLMEHPFYGSWGYQTTGYFAPTARYGSPQDLMHLVDHLHQHGIGVILDWTPAHFPLDEHGLARFDGTHLYEHADARRGFHPEWTSAIYNYGRNEVRSFLVSSARFWLECYHVDGLRVDGVASMLYLDYARKPGEWLPNRYGGKENLEAVQFLRELNTELYRAHPGIQTIAEESTAWPMVSRPVHAGGLGFGFKWDLGWMHDTLSYLARDPVHRSYHHDDLTFRSLYAFTENYVLPLSHDEVVHGKGSLLSKMPGDTWRRLANLRLLLACLYAQPGKKLLFMGAELGEWLEWDHDGALNWDLLEQPGHRGVQRWVADLNRAYRATPALHELDCEPGGFVWIRGSDRAASVYSFLRQGRAPGAVVAVALNATPVPRTAHRMGVPLPGRWAELLNSDADPYGGSGYGNYGGVATDPIAADGHAQSLAVTLPPLGAVFFAWDPAPVSS